MSEEPTTPNTPTGQVKPAAKVAIAALVALTIGLGVLAVRGSHLPSSSPATVQSDSADLGNPQTTEETQALQSAPIPKSPALYTVARTIDGDTIDVRTSTGAIERVRLIGVDTPETHDPRKPVQCFGQAASDYTYATLSGETVRLEADPKDSDRDKYGRLLRYVYLADGTNYNLKLIQEGFAFAYVVFPYSKLNDFRQAEQTAQDGGHGLWASCNVDSSQKIKQTTTSR